MKWKAYILGLFVFLGLMALPIQGQARNAVMYGSSTWTFWFDDEQLYDCGVHFKDLTVARLKKTYPRTFQLVINMDVQNEEEGLADMLDAFPYLASRLTPAEAANMAHIQKIRMPITYYMYQDEVTYQVDGLYCYTGQGVEVYSTTVPSPVYNVNDGRGYKNAAANGGYIFDYVSSYWRNKKPSFWENFGNGLLWGMAYANR